jgi:hypothetical protein
MQTPGDVEAARKLMVSHGLVQGTTGEQLLKSILANPNVRILKKTVSTLGDMASGAYQAATTPPTAQEMQGHMLGPNQPDPLALNPATLLAKRTIVDPLIENYKKFKAAPDLAGKIGYGLGTVPVAGPVGVSLGETASKEGLPEAAGQALAYGVAPELTKGVIKGVSKLPGAISDTVSNAATDAADAYRLKRYGPIQQQIEQKIAPSGNEAKAVTAKISGELAQDPTLVKAKPGEQFDQALYSRFEQSTKALDTAEENIPADLKVSKAPLVSKIQAAIQKLEIPGEPVTTVGEAPQPTLDDVLSGRRPKAPTTTTTPMISGHPDAVSALKASLDTINKLPDEIPFQDLRKFRQQLDKAVRDSGGWKETASSADRAKAQANRFVVNQIRGELANATDVLKEPNAQYSLYHKAMEGAGLSFEDGRRISRVGKVPPLGPGGKLLTMAAKTLLRGAGVAGGYEILHHLEP